MNGDIKFCKVLCIVALSDSQQTSPGSKKMIITVATLYAYYHQIISSCIRIKRNGKKLCLRTSESDFHDEHESNDGLSSHGNQFSSLINVIYIIVT